MKRTETHTRTVKLDDRVNRFPIEYATATYELLDAGKTEEAVTAGDRIMDKFTPLLMKDFPEMTQGQAKGLLFELFKVWLAEMTPPEGSRLQ